MTEPLNLFVRRAGDGPIVLIVNEAGLPKEYIINLGQARNLVLDLLPMILSGSTISPLPIKQSGKPLDGKSVTYRTITVNSPRSENGQATVTR